jgi:hypothetical protein
VGPTFNESVFVKKPVSKFTVIIPTDKFITGGSVPNTAVSAYFPGDAFGFSGSDGLLLDSQALGDFLEALGSTVGTPVDVNAALSLVVCTVTGSDGTQFRFNDTNTYVFEGGVPISVASYQCAVVFGA